MVQQLRQTKRTEPKIEVPRDAIADFCKRHAIRKLALFGSVLRDDFRPDSDVDVLVEFEAKHVPGLIGLAGMEIELTHLVGHKVDLNTPNFFSGPLRTRVLAEAEVFYAAS